MSEYLRPIHLRLLTGKYAVCKLKRWPDVSLDMLDVDQVFSLTRNGEEISLVCPEEMALKYANIEAGWRAFVVAGPLEFSLVGILAKLTKALADASVSVFSISTYDTDILLVKQQDLDAAKQALSTVATLRI